MQGKREAYPPVNHGGTCKTWKIGSGPNGSRNKINSEKRKGEVGKRFREKKGQKENRGEPTKETTSRHQKRKTKTWAGNNGLAS